MLYLRLVYYIKLIYQIANFTILILQKTIGLIVGLLGGVILIVVGSVSGFVIYKSYHTKRKYHDYFISLQ